MTNFTGCDELCEWLIANGFSISSRWQNLLECSECNWCAYRPIELPARECECNEGKMLLVINPYQYFCPDAPQGKLENAEVNVTGEASGMWFQLNCYSLPHDVLRARLGDIERMLVAAWNALTEGKTTEEDI